MSLPAFGVRRPVPANILMISLLLAGAFCALTITREFFPDTTPKSAIVTLPYPGATPEEIEQSLVLKVEDKLAELDVVEMLTTSVTENVATITVEFRDSVRNVRAATEDVERAIETLLDLPEESERIRVTEFKPVLPTIAIALAGDVEEEALKRAIRVMRDEIRSLPGMGDTTITGARDYEIRVDVDPDVLVEQRIPLARIADAISDWLAEVPGGTVRTSEGNINVRAVGVEEAAREIAGIVVLGSADGRALRVGDLARVREYYIEDLTRTRFVGPDGGGRSASLTVYKVGDQDAVRIAHLVRAYAAGRRAKAGLPGGAYEPDWRDRLNGLMGGRAKSDRLLAFELGLNSPVPLPRGVVVTTSSDLARFIEGRIGLLMRNALAGAVLVFATLLVFLNWRTAFWVGMGLLTSLGGTLVFMNVTGVTLNLLTMFGLIIVIGLLVDDAIVVAENIQSRHDAREPAMSAAVTGAEQVSWPVVATVMTTIVAFLPLTFIKGQIGDFLGALPWVVACALSMSLVECLLILPSHVGHSLRARDERQPGRIGLLLRRLEQARDRVLLDRIVPGYVAVLKVCLRFRYIFFSLSLSLLIVSVGLVAGGRVPFEFLPTSDSETIICELRMPIGTPLEETESVVRRLEDAARAQPEMLSISSLVGVMASVDDTSGITAAGLGTHLGQLFVELTPVESRERESSMVIAAIRDAVGTVDRAESISWSEIQGGPSGRDITIQVTGDDDEAVDSAVAALRAALERIEGVYDVADDDTRGQREIRIRPKPEAAAVGLTVREIARQVRGALYGFDAHVFSAEREDIDVRVRIDEAARRSIDRVESLWIMTAEGEAVPLSEIVDLETTSAYNRIRRVDRKRAITVTADTAPDLSPEVAMLALEPDLAGIRLAHPTVGVETAGRQRQMRKAFESLPVGFLVAVGLIYVILAWLFGSYTQPLAVMFAIPFGVIGVVWGHLLLGYSLTFLSLIGFVALSGIVVNDSLILVQFFNGERERGRPFVDALLDSGRRRFRPIILTTTTTVLGLTPLMLEQSFQAKFLIPMAIAISFGLMSATVLILVLLPGILLIVDDLRRALGFLWRGGAAPPQSALQTAMEAER